ncbi:hypothetical protein [Acidithiobacillus sulfuriphilus]|uniref:Uncharacterized protein n=1 Tax=Acidithiobacillus sulfuriphilus TaxID=1867749 RepID=A0ACD5HS70_9PROT|nr:hypothetical protein [Acidithiobacillus sulfuriphilus]
MNAHQKHNSISATAKALDLTYYTTQVILREEKTRQNRAKRRAQIEEAKGLAQGKTPIEDIAQIFGKPAGTIRRWTSSGS